MQARPLRTSLLPQRMCSQVPLASVVWPLAVAGTPTAHVGRSGSLRFLLFEVETADGGASAAKLGTIFVAKQTCLFTLASL